MIFVVVYQGWGRDFVRAGLGVGDDDVKGVG